MAANSRFLILDVQFYFDGNAKIITAISDVPCHLYMRYQTTGIVLHERILIERGVVTTRDPHLAFDNWLLMEQQEEGDTLHHTFVLDPFLPCQTFFYQFSGYIGGEFSPSLSPIFKQHRPIPPPPPEATHFLGFGIPRSTGTLPPDYMWGSRAVSPIDGWALRIVYKVKNLGGNPEPIKYALYTGGLDVQTLIATSDWGVVPPFFDDFFTLELTTYPQIALAETYSYLWWISSNQLLRYWGPGGANVGCVKLFPWTYWPQAINLGHNGWGACAGIWATIHDPYP